MIAVRQMDEPVRFEDRRLELQVAHASWQRTRFRLGTSCGGENGRCAPLFHGRATASSAAAGGRTAEDKNRAKSNPQAAEKARKGGRALEHPAHHA
jgi:hypothetical protein